MFRLVRKDDEKEDSNFPPTLHAAMELFGRVEMMAQALTCKKHVDVFLLDRESVVPHIDWDTMLHNSKLDYGGEVALKAKDTTWSRVEHTLPPLNLAGAVDALELAGSLTPFYAFCRSALNPADRPSRRFRRRRSHSV